MSRRTLEFGIYRESDYNLDGIHVGKDIDMSNETNLARLVARTLDNAEGNCGDAIFV